MNVLTVWEASAAVTSARVPSRRMRSFSAQAESRPARVVGGIFVARWSTAPQSWSAARREATSNRSAATGSAPSWRSRVAFASERLRPRTVWPAATRRRTTGRPRTPVAPVTKILMRSCLSSYLLVCLHGLFAEMLIAASGEQSARSAAKALLKPRERFFDGAWIRPLGEAAHEIGDGLRAERLAPGHLGAQHGGVDGTEQAVHRRLEGSGAALANLGAAEGGITPIDGVADRQYGALGGRPCEPIAAFWAGDRDQAAGGGQRLEMLDEIAFGDAVVLGEGLARQHRAGGDDREQRGAMQSPLDAITQLHTLPPH